MNLGRTKLARLLVVALTIAAAAAGLARADLASGTPQLQFLGQYIIPTGTQFQGTEVGGLSGIAYDARHRLFYALSDDPSQIDPARFYTLRIESAGGAPTVQVLDVTALTDSAGQPFPPQSLDPEGIALTTRRTLVITSEGFASRLIDPWVREFNLNGRQLRDLPVPDAFRPNAAGTRGVRQNLGFESASATPSGRWVFTGTEGALVQDGPPATVAAGSPARLLRYDTWIGWLDRQYVYWTDPIAKAPVPPTAFAVSGLVELLPLDNADAALDGALVLRRRPRHGQHDQALHRVVGRRDERQRRREHCAAARQPDAGVEVAPARTSMRSGSRSTTSRGWTSAKRCPTDGNRSCS